MNKENVTPLHKGLLMHNKVANFLIRFANNVLGFVKLNKTNLKVNGSEIKKILICNNAHLGDVLLSTAILPVIKKKYPNSEIHFLCGSWSKEILSNNPLVNKLYYFDHWKLNRTKKAFFKKVIQYIKTFWTCVKVLRKDKIDLAIDLYFYYPNSIFLLWFCKIPFRIGYTSGGWGNLLTHPVHWEYKQQSIIYYHLALLRLGNKDIEISDIENLKPSILLRDSSYKKINDIISKNNLRANELIIFHIGTGYELKEWPLENWKNLALKLIQDGKKIIFTGYGKREAALIDYLFNDSKIKAECFNLCNELTLNELACIVSFSKLIVCVDSLISHIASCFDVTCLIIGNGINDKYLWRPLSKKNKLFINSVPCMPCYSGCDTMECVKGISFDFVLEQINYEL